MADQIAIMNGACLSLFSTGKTKGLVVEIGEGATHTVPIFEGLALQHASLTNDIAGQDITKSLIDGMIKKGMKITPTMSEYGRDIKEKMCSIPIDYSSAIAAPDPLSEEQRSYELPDGSIIQANHNTRYDATEILFNPEKFGLKGKSIPQMIVESLKKCPKFIRNVFLSDLHK